MPEVKHALKTFRDILGGDDVPISALNRENMLEYKKTFRHAKTGR